jgi:hypothetical protein
MRTVLKNVVLRSTAIRHRGLHKVPDGTGAHHPPLLLNHLWADMSRLFQWFQPFEPPLKLQEEKMGSLGRCLENCAGFGIPYMWPSSSH